MNEQKEMVRDHLHKHGSINSLEAINEYGITRLSAVIYKLRHHDSMPIQNRIRVVTNRYGKKVNVTDYVWVNE